MTILKPWVMCPICSNETQFVFNVWDNEFWMCQSCGHGFLKDQRPQDFSYRSPQSNYSKRAIAWSLGHIQGHYRCALDFGANDGYLLKQVSATKKIGVDVDFGVDAGIEWHPTLETVKDRPSLVVCRHTLEHLKDPLNALYLLTTIADDNAEFHIEVPCLDSIVEALRFDQIYDQHYHYFSRMSLSMALGKAGIGGHFTFSSLGPFAMHATCRRGKAFWLPNKVKGVGEAYRKYMGYMGHLRSVLNDRQWYAWGASTVMPGILRWVGEPLGVIDSDERKNLLPPSAARGKNILVTSPDNFKEIYDQALQNGAKHVFSASPILT